MPEFKLTNIQPSSFFMALGFTEAESAELILSSCVHHKGEPAFKTNQTWLEFGEANDYFEYSRDGVMGFLDYQPVDVKYTDDFKEAFDQADSWNSTAIHPTYAAINRVMSARYDLFNITDNETISMYIDGIKEMIGEDLSLADISGGKVLPITTPGLENPFKSYTGEKVHPVHIHGLSEYLVWLISFCESFFTKEFEKEIGEIPFDIELVIVNARKFSKCETIDEVIKQTKRCGMYISQIHNSWKLNFKEMDEGIFEQDSSLEAWVNISGVWVSIGFLGAVGLVPQEIWGLSAEFVLSIPDMEKFNIEMTSKEIEVEVAVVVYDNDYNEQTILESLSTGELVADIDSKVILEKSSKKTIAKIVDVKVGRLLNPDFATFENPNTPF
jgi:hypothetical protein